jgi:hypothetical protein
MRVVLVGRGFALRRKFTTLQQTHAEYGVVNPLCTLWCAAARLAGVGALEAPIDSVILVTTLWKSNVSATGAN